MLNSPELRLSYTAEPVPTLSVGGELDVATAPALRESFLGVLNQDDVPDLVVDARGLTFVDSSGIAVLLMAARRWTAEERRLTLRSPSPQLIRVIDLLGVRRAFEIGE